MLILSAFIAGGVAAVSAMGWLALKCYRCFVPKKGVSLSYSAKDPNTPDRRRTSDLLIARALPIGDSRNRSGDVVQNVSDSRETGFALFGRTWFSRKTTRTVDVIYHAKPVGFVRAATAKTKDGNLIIPKLRPRTGREGGVITGKHKRTWSA